MYFFCTSLRFNIAITGATTKEVDVAKSTIDLKPDLDSKLGSKYKKYINTKETTESIKIEITYSLFRSSKFCFLPSRKIISKMTLFH